MSTTALDILIRAKDEASRQIKNVGGAVEAAGSRADRSAARMGRFGSATRTAGSRVSTAVKGIGAAVGFVAIDELATKSLEAFDLLDVGEKRLAFGLQKIGENKKQLNGLVDWAKNFSNQTGIAEADIVGMESKLTAMGGTFLKSLGPKADGTIKKITSGMVNLASATGKSASLLLRSLGPALMNEPATAASALKKYGVLTDKQVVKIKALVKAGKSHKASMIEINALYKKFNGVAAASETPMQKLKNAINQLELGVGSLINHGLGWLISTGWPALKNGVDSAMQAAAPFLAMLKNAAAGILPSLKSAFLTILPAVKQLLSALAPVAKVLGIVLGLIVVGLLKALPTLIKVLATVIATGVRLAAILISSVVGAFQDVSRAIGGIINIGQRVVGWIRNGFDNAVSFISGLPGRIGRATVGMFDGIKNAFRGAIDWVIRGWNSLQFTLPKVNTHIPGVGTIGGWSLGTPDIPLLANGGIATRATLAVIGEAGPEAVIPLSKAGGMLGGNRLELLLDRRRFVAAGDFDVKYRGF